MNSDSLARIAQST